MSDIGRMVLEYFDRRPDTVSTVEDLAAAIDARDAAVETETRITIRLHHVVLPKLADRGNVDYDPRSKTVRYRTSLDGSERVTDGRSRGRTGERGKPPWR